MSVTAARIRDVRSCLKLSQGEFGAIFTSQRKAGQKLNARGVSYWETGRSQPTHKQLEQLLDFLEDPDLYLAEERPGFSEWTAVRFLAWYDPQAEGIDLTEAFGGILEPRRVLGRRRSLEPLVFGILDLQESQADWSKRLERCSTFSSSAPFEEIKIARRSAKDGEAFNLADHEGLLRSDIERHGPCIAGLILKEHRNTEKEDAGFLMDRFLKVYGTLFSGVTFGEETFEEQVDDLTVDGAYGFNLAVLMVSTVISAVDPEHRDTVLGQLIERSRLLDLLILNTRSAQTYAKLADLAGLRLTRAASKTERPEDAKKAAALLARYAITQDPKVFQNAP